MGVFYPYTHYKCHIQTRTHSIYKICYHGKIWGLYLLWLSDFFLLFYISASQAALQSKHRGFVAETVYVVLCTQLCKEKVSLMEGLVTQCDSISTPYLHVTTICTHTESIPTIYCTFVLSLCHRLKCCCDTVAFSHEYDACEVPVVHSYHRWSSLPPRRCPLGIFLRCDAS